MLSQNYHNTGLCKNKTKQIKTNYYWTEGNSFSLGSVLSVVPKMVCVSGNFFSGFVCCLEEFMHFMLLWHSLQLNSLSCWHCLCLAILFLCHHLVWSSVCGAREIRKAWSAWSAWSGIVLPHDSGAISEAVCICACNPKLLIACHRAVSPLLSDLVVCWFGLHALFYCVTFHGDLTWQMVT